ncbi:hypothetical protein E8E12_003582 [Didymella heteroderae]|uniref:Uncharacterized protein n=1 Tax=Didymella heteroderae TaxID=1769908 RepID=A0A9P4WZE1_9PLEO|nr:hypothetical protein E8E12_003582 [Didymella heteroderae]
MMQKHDWTTPETIDLPVFLSSFHLYPNLVREIVDYQRVFGRLREFRNHTAHGSGGMTTGDISLALDDVVAAARFFRSAELAAKVKRYRVLLKEFTTRQNEDMKRAYKLIRPFKAKLEARLETIKTALKDVESAPDNATRQSVASEAAMIEEVWTRTERSLVQLNARSIARLVGEAQIRRVAKNLGSDANAVLSSIQKEQAASSDNASSDTGTEEILSSLSEKLSQFEAQDSGVLIAKAKIIESNSAIGFQRLTPELLDSLPSCRRAPSDRSAHHQKEQLRQLADMVRKKG